MTQQHPINPPPELMKQWREQAPRYRDGGIAREDWLMTRAAQWGSDQELEVATDEELNSKSSPNNLQIRSSDLDVTIALVQQWTDEIYGGPGVVVGSDDICLAKLAAQYGADQELEACCAWFVRDWTDVETADNLRAARRPKPPSLKEQALEALDEEQAELSIQNYKLIRSVLESLPDHE